MTRSDDTDVGGTFCLVQQRGAVHERFPLCGPIQLVGDCTCECPRSQTGYKPNNVWSGLKHLGTHEHDGEGKNLDRSSRSARIVFQPFASGNRSNIVSTQLSFIGHRAVRTQSRNRTITVTSLIAQSDNYSQMF